LNTIENNLFIEYQESNMITVNSEGSEVLFFNSGSIKDIHGLYVDRVKLTEVWTKIHWRGYGDLLFC